MTQDHTKLAVYNNAVWCATVCGAHGWPGEFHAEIWINGCASLPYYPNAVTLTAQDTVTQLEQIRQLDGAGPTENSPRWWASCVAAVSALFPDLPLVGYERGDDLNFAQSAGFSALAPLRVWLKARAEM